MSDTVKSEYSLTLAYDEELHWLHVVDGEKHTNRDEPLVVQSKAAAILRGILLIARINPNAIINTYPWVEEVTKWFIERRSSTVFGENNDVDISGLMYVGSLSGVDLMQKFHVRKTEKGAECVSITEFGRRVTLSEAEGDSRDKHLLLAVRRVLDDWRDGDYIRYPIIISGSKKLYNYLAVDGWRKNWEWNGESYANSKTHRQIMYSDILHDIHCVIDRYKDYISVAIEEKPAASES